MSADLLEEQVIDAPGSSSKQQETARDRKQSLEVSPIFVVGTARAGTTLVANILGREATLFSPGESHFFEIIWARREHLGPLTSAGGLADASELLMSSFGQFNQHEAQALVEKQLTKDELIRQTLACGGGYDSLYATFMGALAESQGKSRFCDDTPKHLFYLDDLFSLFPKARVIGCVRDPRDFLCSYKGFWKRSDDPDRIRALYHPIVTSLLWRSSMNVLRESVNGAHREKTTWVQYEKLVMNPEMEVRRLCDFAGLTYDPQMIAVDSHNSSFNQSENGIYQGSVGRWRECLTDAEVWWAQVITGRQMRAFEYESASIRPGAGARLKILLTLPAAFFRALRANRERRGPLVGYIWRRLKSLIGQ